LTATERVMRTMKLSFIVAGFLIIYVMLKIPAAHLSRPANPTLELVIAAVAFINLVLGLLARRFFARFATTSRSGAKSTPLSQWFSANVLSLALIESCLLFGFVLNRLGGSVRLVELLCGSAMIAFLFWSPGRPPAPEDGNNSSR
jgi:hypothetical protein